MEGKTNFSMRLKQFGGLTWLTLTILLFSDNYAIDSYILLTNLCSLHVRLLQLFKWKIK